MHEAQGGVDGRMIAVNIDVQSDKTTEPAVRTY